MRILCTYCVAYAITVRLLAAVMGITGTGHWLRVRRMRLPLFWVRHGVRPVVR